jgi:hypothetical protein
MAKRKDYKFTMQNELGLEIMEQDAEKIRQLTPGFQLEPRVLPVNELQDGPKEHKPVLNMPTNIPKKKKPVE